MGESRSQATLKNWVATTASDSHAVSTKSTSRLVTRIDGRKDNHDTSVHARDTLVGGTGHLPFRPHLGLVLAGSQHACVQIRDTREDGPVVLLNPCSSGEAPRRMHRRIALVVLGKAVRDAGSVVTVDRFSQP